MQVSIFQATPVRIETVCVSWREEWRLDRYLETYMRTRGIRDEGRGRSAILECLGRYTGRAPYRKSDLDYFLDANFARPRR